jgi:starch phosphorylase
VYDGENGWAIPSADGVDDPTGATTSRPAALYDLLENEVARFYDRRRRRADPGWRWCGTRW